MNLQKFRHKNPRNAGYINKSVVCTNFSRFARQQSEKVKQRGLFPIDENQKQFYLLFCKE